MEIFTDTIVAPITAPLRAPVAWIRVSGPDAWKIARSVFRRKGAEAPEEDYRPRYAYYGEIFSGSEIIDEGLLILFEEGKSYTGESSFELSCHGSPAIVRKIVEAILQAGARPARPGEFTERAFVNGRIDLTRAEAVRETVEAVTEAQLRRARLLREGRLAERVEAWEEAVAKELARAEASVDFSEEIGELNREAVAENLRQVLGEIEEVLHTYPSARLLREGLRVAIVGRTNVGKSSLLNALLGTERAIVTDIPGTTRDTIEETLSVKGFPVVLTDTAGIRETEDRVESLGVMRSKKAVETADQVWFVYEAPLGWTPEDSALLKDIGRAPALYVANKCDLLKDHKPPQKEGAILVSALTGAGLPQLLQKLEESFEIQGEIPLINDRHQADLAEAHSFLQNAIATLQTDLPTDLVCVDLYGAVQSLGKITGRTATADILERIFREFCIGK